MTDPAQKEGSPTPNAADKIFFADLKLAAKGKIKLLLKFAVFKPESVSMVATKEQAAKILQILKPDEPLELGEKRKAVLEEIAAVSLKLMELATQVNQPPDYEPGDPHAHGKLIGKWYRAINKLSALTPHTQEKGS